LRRVEEQLPEALDYLSRALLAGHSLPMSLELLADESEPPFSVELRKTIDEYNLGLSMDDALRNLVGRLPSVDIQFFVSAIQTQTRTGGSLHELLEDLAETIRERMTLKRQVRALTANGRMTAVVLSALPFVVAGTMLYVNPDYFDLLLKHPWGPTLLFMALGGQVAAYLVIRRIVNIKV
jgi:tight adherence protein B